MNSLIYVIKISKALKAKTLTVFLHQFSRLFCLLSSKILQNNLLDLHLVEICRYKLSFYAKTAQMLLPTHRHFFYIFEKSLCEAQNSQGAGATHIIGLSY